MKSNIGRGAIISYVAIFINIIISFVYTPWMLHQIGASDYGLYSLINSFIAYFIIDFGLTSAIARFVAKYRAEGNDTKVENILGLTLRIFFAIDTVIFVCVLVSYFFITEIFTGLTCNELERLKVLYIIASTFSILSFGLKPLDGALTAYEYFVPAKLIDMIYKVGSVLFIVIALSCGGNIYHLVFINGVLSFLTHLYRYVYWHRKTGLTPNLLFNDRQEAIEVFSFSGWTFLVGLAQRFRLNLIPSVLGIFANSTEIAIFALGMTVEAMTYTLSSALNGLFLPKVTRLIHSGEQNGLSDLMIRVGRIQLFIILLIYSGFIIFGYQFIYLWVGEQYIDVYYIVIFLITVYIISNTTSIAIDAIYAKNLVKHTARITFVTSLLGLIGSISIAGRFGAIGCSVCTGIALIITQIAFLGVYKKKLGINIKHFIFECHFKILPPIMLLVFFSLSAFSFINVSSWLPLFFEIVLYGIAYILVTYKFLLNNSERSLIKAIVKFKI